MSEPEAHISTWEAAGLIDGETAARLRAAGSEAGPSAASRPGVWQRDEASLAAAMFGPSVTIPEVFGYLGSGFLLAGWTAFFTRIGGSERLSGAGFGSLIAAIALVGLGFLLHRGDERRRRAAGVAFLVSVAYAAAGVAALLSSAGIDGPEAAVIATAVGLGLALYTRLLHPSVLTQIGLLGAITAFAAAVLTWLNAIVVPEQFTEQGLPLPGRPDPILLVIVSAVWWLLWAVVIGAIGLREARMSRGGAAEASSRRAAVSRFWAGVVAVAGIASAVTRQAPDATGNYGRVLEPWIGELAIVLVSVALLERAFRRDATSFVYAAALGLIIALSDFNFTYLSETTEIGLVIEGAILLGVGLAADRLRRQIGQGTSAETEAPASDGGFAAGP